MVSLSELLAHLREVVDQEGNGPRSAVALDDPQLSRWEDQDFVYLEADLSEDFGPAIDICIHRGRAYIRISRS